jgi:hypothetical protein
MILSFSNNAVMDRLISCFLAVVYANCFRKQLFFLKSIQVVQFDPSSLASCLDRNPMASEDELDLKS